MRAARWSASTERERQSERTRGGGLTGEGKLSGTEPRRDVAVAAAAAAAATVSPVSRLLPAWQAGGNTERERSAEGDTEREAGHSFIFILVALLWHSELQTCCEEVDLDTGHRSEHPWITSSE